MTRLQRLKREATPIRFLAAVALTTLLLWSLLAAFPDGKLHLTICDVGQGDGLILTTPRGLNLVVDGGPDTSILECLGKAMPFYDRTIEAIFLTHPHSDHATGLGEILRRYQVLEILDTGQRTHSAGDDLYQELVVKEIGGYNAASLKFALSRGQTVVLDGVRLQVLSPGKNGNVDSKINDASLVLLLAYGKFKAFLPGDAGVPVWGELDRENVFLPSVTVLKVPHHGSRTGVSQELLAKLKPALAVISVGANNRYGHPHPELLGLLAQNKVHLLRTDQDGTIEIRTDGEWWEWNRRR